VITTCCCSTSSTGGIGSAGIVIIRYLFQ
jgi:hypothetical protein